MKQFLKKLHNSRGEMLLEALVAIVIVVLAISMLSTAVLTASRINKNANASETVYVLSGGSTGGGESSQSGRAEMKFIYTESTFDGTAHGNEVKLSWVKVDGVKLQNLSNITVQYKNEANEWVGWGDETPNSKPTYTNAGNYTVNVRLLVDDETTYTGSYLLKIQKRNVTLTSASSTAAYNGAEKDPKNEITIGGDGFVEGDGLDYTKCKILGQQTTIGSSSNDFTYALLLTETHDATYYTDNYNITTKKGTLVVGDSANSAIAINNFADILTQSYTFDGDSHGVQPDFQLKSGDSSSLTVLYKLSTEDADAWGGYSAERFQLTDVGSIEVQYYATAAGEDALQGSYTITVEAREVTLSSASLTETYNGTALSAPDITIGGDGFLDGDAPTDWKATGSQTVVGSCTNTIPTDTLPKSADYYNKNYKISKTEGTLTVTRCPITIDSASGESFYYGKTLAELYTDLYTISGKPDNGAAITGITCKLVDSNNQEYNSSNQNTVLPTGTYTVKLSVDEAQNPNYSFTRISTDTQITIITPMDKIIQDFTNALKNFSRTDTSGKIKEDNSLADHTDWDYFTGSSPSNPNYQHGPNHDYWQYNNVSATASENKTQKTVDCFKTSTRGGGGSEGGSMGGPGNDQTVTKTELTSDDIYTQWISEALSKRINNGEDLSVQYTPEESYPIEINGVDYTLSATITMAYTQIGGCGGIDYNNCPVTVSLTLKKGTQVVDTGSLSGTIEKSEVDSDDDFTYSETCDKYKTTYVAQEKSSLRTTEYKWQWSKCEAVLDEDKKQVTVTVNWNCKASEITTYTGSVTT